MGQTITGLRPRTGHTPEDGQLFAGEADCCTRTFANLARHMERQHPDYPERKETT